MGRSHSLPPSLRYVVSRTRPTHKYTRDKGSSLLHNCACSFRNNHSSVYRQPSSNVHHQQDALQVEGSFVRAPSPNRCHASPFSGHQSVSHSLLTEQQSRCSQSPTVEPTRTLTFLFSVPSSHELEGPSSSRFNDFSRERSTATILSSALRQPCVGMQRAGAELVTVGTDLLFPPSMADSQDLSETPDVQGSRPSDPPLDSSGAVVSRDSGSGQEVEAPTGFRNSHYWVAQLRTLERLSFLTLALSQVHGADIAEHLASAHRPSTIRQAQSVWKKFQSWLPLDATNITRDTVLKFLIYLASGLRLNSCTVINYRGALALPLKNAFQIDFEDESFNFLTRSQFLQNPPQPKTIPSWSLDVELQALSAQRVSLQ